MELVWHRGYEDYQDSAWSARKDYLTGIWKSLTPEKAAAMDTSLLTDRLESLEELMRYYASTEDFRSLEPLMRSHEALLGLLRSRKPDTAEYWYLEMEYSRVNAMLYLNQGNTRQAVRDYEQTVSYADRCFSRLQSADGFSEEQRLYLAWSCAECRNEMAMACERILDSRKMYQILNTLLPLLQYVENCLGDAHGICEKTADLYSRIGAACYQNNDPDGGDRCYERAEQLFNRLACLLASNFYRARELWVRGLHGIDAFLHTGNTAVMLDCEKAVLQFLNDGADRCDRAIAEGALAMNYMQRGTAIQQACGDINEAIKYTEQSADLFGNAQEALKKDADNMQSQAARGTISDIAARLYSSSVTAMDILGVQYYAAGRNDEAEAVFEEVLSMLTDTGGYTLAESSSLVIRAESCEYLALLAAGRNDSHKTIFYGTQAMDFGEEAARSTGAPAAWQIVIVSASLVSEIAGIMKEKQKMGETAARGLAACDELARLMPENEILAMRTNLEKRVKKATRRFFG